MTALHYAVENKNREMTAHLLFEGADPNAATQDGTTPLILAVSKQQPMIRNNFV